MVNWRSRKLEDFLWLANTLALVVMLNMLAANWFFRIDLTEEKRYTIKKPTRELLQSLEEEVYVEVFLEGELNAEFRRFKKSIRETLEEFRIYSGNKVRYVFTDPATAIGEKARNEFMSDLAGRGIQPTNVVDNQNGQRVEKLIFPGAIISHSGFETGVMLLKGNSTSSSEERINQSVEGVEYELAAAIRKLANAQPKSVGLLRGHGELDSLSIAALEQDLSELYDVSEATLTSLKDVRRHDALIIAKPTEVFTEKEKYVLDQFVMGGGKVMFLLDRLSANMDSVSSESALAIPNNTNLDDQLFRYGVRINQNLVQDQNSGLYPIVTGRVGDKPQMQLLNWPFFPLINNYPDHPITRNLDAVLLRFTSSMDTVKAEGVRKTPLMLTSPYSRTVGAPVDISVNQLRKLQPQELSGGPFPVAYLLEGKFPSLYRNRFLPEGVDSTGRRNVSEENKILVVADGDVAKNEVNPRTRTVQPVGFDPFTNYTFANRDFILNSLSYLIEEDGLIQSRTKQVKIRPLDKAKIASEKVWWQIFNLTLPLVLLLIYGLARFFIRRRRYSNF